jgi:hypothetical protein
MYVLLHTTAFLRSRTGDVARLACMHVYMHVCIALHNVSVKRLRRAGGDVAMQICMHVRMNVCMYICIYIYVYIYICKNSTCIDMHTYIYV